MKTRRTLAQTGVVTRHTEMPRVTSLFTASTFGQKRGPASCMNKVVGFVFDIERDTRSHVRRPLLT